MGSVFMQLCKLNSIKMKENAKMKTVVKFSDRNGIEQEAAKWLIRLDGDKKLSRKEQKQLNEWLESNPLHRKELLELAGMWSDINILTELAVPIDKPKHRFSGFFSSWMPQQTAALMASLVAFMAVALVYFYSAVSMQSTNGLYVTDIGFQKSAKLADGSLMQLNTNTRVRVEYGNGFRNVYLLQGEAHFTVAKNKKLPFRVFAGVGRIHAVGTAFTVYLKDNEVDVTVSEGQVALASIAPSDTVTESLDGSTKGAVQKLGMLNAGQIVTISSQFDDKSKRVEVLNNLRSVGDNDIAKRLAWRNGVLVFSGESLGEVVKEISRYTTVSIEFSDPELKTTRIGGRFPVGETEAMFTLLESSFGYKVKRLDKNRVLVSGK